MLPIANRFIEIAWQPQSRGHGTWPKVARKPVETADVPCPRLDVRNKVSRISQLRPVRPIVIRPACGYQRLSSTRTSGCVTLHPRALPNMKANPRMAKRTHGYRSARHSVGTRCHPRETSSSHCFRTALERVGDTRLHDLGCTIPVMSNDF